MYGHGHMIAAVFEAVLKNFKLLGLKSLTIYILNCTPLCIIITIGVFVIVTVYCQ